MATKVSVVTGSNRGIGLEVVRALVKSDKFFGDVYLTARDEAKGREALEQLAKDGVGAKFHQLDINDEGSVRRLAAFLKEKSGRRMICDFALIHSNCLMSIFSYGGLDILVNNAAIAYKQAATEPFGEQVHRGTVLRGQRYCTIYHSKYLHPNVL